MSVAEHAETGFGPEPQWGDGPSSYAPGEAPRGVDRTPPQDMAAEQWVLGSMLLSKDAIADVVEVMRGTDFYRPAHEIVHDAISTCGRGEPADPVTVAAELQRRGELARVGGAPYLHTLIRRRSDRRECRLLRARSSGSRRSCGGWSRPARDRPDRVRRARAQVDDVVDQAQAEVYEVTERRTRRTTPPLSDIMQHVLDEIEAIGNREAAGSRRTHRLRRPRRPDQRSAHRPDDHRRCPPR